MAPRLPTGPAAAAVVAAGLGLMALGLSQVGAEASESFKAWLQAVGNAWMPGAGGIGPYSGKETVALVVWCGTWAGLHFAWRRREVSVTVAGVAALILIGLATTLVWPPVTEWLAHR